MNRLDWLLISLCAVAFCGLVVTTKKAQAHDPQTYQADSLADAKSDAYGVCCNGDDYTKVRVNEWEPTDTGWRVRWQGKWYDAPRRTKVSNMDNPDGEAKVWINGPDGGPFYVRCFMPGQLS
jgi:hypothetical protein